MRQTAEDCGRLHRRALAEEKTGVNVRTGNPYDAWSQGEGARIASAHLAVRAPVSRSVEGADT